MTWVVLLVPPDKYLSFQSVPTPVFFFPPHWPVSHLTFTECPLPRLPQLVLQNKSLFFLRFFFVFFFFFYHQIAPLKMRKTEPWTKSEIHYRSWLRRRRPDKSKLQISFDARKEQLNIYKTAGKKKKTQTVSLIFIWRICRKPRAFFITISSLITRSDASSLHVSSKNLPGISVCEAEKYQRAHLFCCREPALNQLILLILFILYQFSFQFSSETVSHKTNSLLFGCHVLVYYHKTDVGNCCGSFLRTTVLQIISKNLPLKQ